MNGDPWEFKRNRRGKLVLIDFWSTTCKPCIQTMPALVKLQSRYDPRDLEVLGIAVESGGTSQEQAYRVTNLCTRLGINYRQLLSGSAGCPVCRDFGIEVFPTMFLIDQNGTIIWQHKGRPDPYDLAVLQRHIDAKLNGAKVR